MRLNFMYNKILNFQLPFFIRKQYFIDINEKRKNSNYNIT